MSAEVTVGRLRESIDPARPIRWGALYVAEHRLRVMRTYLQTLVATAVGSPLVYLFGLGVGLAALVNRQAGQALHEPVGYLPFVAPALLASVAVTVASEEFTYPVLAGFKWNAIFQGMNAAPISPSQIVDGMILSILVRILPTTIVYFLFMLLFGAVPSLLGALGVLTATATGLAVGLAIMAYTATITEDRGQMALIQRFGIVPMFLFSGTFFPLTQLPIGLQCIGWISPLWHGAQLGRDLSYDTGEPAWLIVVHGAYLLALIVVGWLLIRRTFRRRLGA